VGNGVVVFDEGKILGGDSNYYYTGIYSHGSSSITARLRVQHYAGPLNNVFGPLRQVELALDGSVGADLIMAQGYVVGQSSARASFRLRRVVQRG
jgi:hypothetical protein